MKLTDLEKVQELQRQRTALKADLERATKGTLSVELGKVLKEGKVSEPPQGSYKPATKIVEGWTVEVTYQDCFAPWSHGGRIEPVVPVTYNDQSMNDSIRSAVIVNLQRRIWSVEDQLRVLGVVVTTS